MPKPHKSPKVDECPPMIKQKILDNRKLRNRRQNTRSPQDKAKLNKAVKELEQGHSNLFGKLGTHRILAMESHQTTTAATNTNRPH